MKHFDGYNWSNFDEAMLCPACSSGRIIGQTGDANGHLSRAWIDNLDRKIDVEHDGLRVGPSASDGRGSEIGMELHYEQCRHVIEIRFRFHKGDVYLNWRIVREVEESPEGELDRPIALPRT